ncbi:MAG: tyrosine-type recombinase/integrase, partial [Dethiobacteria bacterium]|jgi:integrase/recombinase XerD
MLKEEKKTRKLPDILTVEEQKDLLAQPNPKAPTGLRNLCLMRLMLNAGLRLSEIINLKPGDLDLANSRLIVKNNNKERVLLLGEEDRDLLNQWMEIRPKGEYVFSTLKGNMLDSRYIREMVKRLAKKANIKKNIFPHTLRHTFAADLYRKTRNIRMVQEALGHADLSTTMIYTYIIDEELEDAMKFFRQGSAA